jgi:tRNA uridine 5-carbamoylmethylation protein Kti12
MKPTDVLIPSMQQNSQLDLAFNFVQYTDKNIFLTGKAGTGKTTFLHQLKKTSLKRMAVVAPTGVAAINAGGVTINSFFQLPFGPYIPGNTAKTEHKRFSKEKINLIKSLDLLVIDEISMVRADTVDQIDEVLRRFKDHKKPFGGVQLLMIGDLHQLSPVVKDEDWAILKNYYPNLFFFSSKALMATQPVSIELKHIYRQVDSDFIDLLNSVRQNKIDENVLKKLNQRYIPDFNPSDEEGYITLTTHNKSAQEINEGKLKELSSPVHRFKAVIQDDFPEYSYPTVAELELKKGAQVMFVKNDPSRERLFFNGKIGIITSISDDHILVKCPGDLSEIVVNPLEWTNIKYELDTQTKELREKIIGTFTQFPLKLAWAITIHKSQGLTFEKAVIDANLAFAHGQVYVALSRCKSFEGMVLRSPISFNSVKTDGTISEYTRNAKDNEPGEQQLIASRIAFQQSLIFELFDFNTLKSHYFHLKKLSEDHHTILDPGFTDSLNQMRALAEKEIYEVADNFKKHLTNYFSANILPEENTELQNRIKKACAYFNEKISTVFYEALKKLNTDTDNKAVGTLIKGILDDFFKEIAIKTALMKAISDGFNTTNYLKTKSNTEIDYKPAKIPSINTSSSENILHPELYQAIRAWRDELAREWGVPLFLVLAQKSILEILRLLPSNPAELENVKGLGKTRVKQYGSDLLEIINSYCKEHGIEREVFELPIKEKKIKTDTKKLSFDLFKQGKTISEIAKERAFTTGTIEGHLAHYILSAEISVFDIVPKIKVAKIMAYLIQNPESSTLETKIALGDEVSYGEIRAVLNHLAYTKSEQLT